MFCLIWGAVVVVGCVIESDIKGANEEIIIILRQRATRGKKIQINIVLNKRNLLSRIFVYNSLTPRQHGKEPEPGS